MGYWQVQLVIIYLTLGPMWLCLLSLTVDQFLRVTNKLFRFQPGCARVNTITIYGCEVAAFRFSWH